MAKVTFNEAICKGCGLCVEACPKKIVFIDQTRVNSKGYNPATVVETEKCIGCASCAVMCPDCVITVVR
ncbi:MAG: 4Fe-4S binding protein [Clostridia bacterium]